VYIDCFISTHLESVVQDKKPNHCRSFLPNPAMQDILDAMPVLSQCQRVNDARKVPFNRREELFRTFPYC